MNYNLYEISVSPKNDKFQKTLYIIFTILKYLNLTVIGVSLVLTVSLFTYFIVVALIFVVSYLICLYFSSKFYNYYDYSFVGGSIRIIKVVNNKMRRLTIDFDAKNIISIGNVFGETYNKYYKDKSVKNLFASPNAFTEDDIVIYFNKSGKDYLLFLQYDEGFMTVITKYIGTKKLDKDFIEKIKNS